MLFLVVFSFMQNVNQPDSCECEWIFACVFEELCKYHPITINFAIFGLWVTYILFLYLNNLFSASYSYYLLHENRENILLYILPE